MRVLQVQWLGAQALGLNLDPAIPILCDLEQVTWPSKASVFLSTFQKKKKKKTGM